MFLQWLSKIKSAKHLFSSQITCSSVVSCQHTAHSGPLCSHIITRNVGYAYRPNAAKRMRKHGLEKRLSCRSQREILFRRIIKGRTDLCVFPRLFNELPEHRKKGNRRVVLNSKDKGFRSIMKETDYYKYH
ncbi:39S ribosomal protein L34 [Mactra antiquata]